ncbi:unnamed protein product [Sphenostylis stenocarpa]|uniref:Uncharacterized protein n=1 Tax=Sphenostylis stenocarpa TaxID=92480 RepID=A0AA86STW9_9FABA|nr:unnamed protein product [Sphenostylis stenocarpa]
MERKPLVIRLSPTTDPPKEANKPQSLVITVNKEEGARMPLNLFMPRPFPYKSNKVVSWKYTVNEDISNIVSIGGMTRSKQIYSPKESQEDAPKNKETEEQNNKKSKEETNELL